MNEREEKVLAVRKVLVQIFWEQGPQDFNLSALRVLEAVEQVEREFEYAR